MKYPGTVEVLPAIEMMPKVPSFLRDTFFPRTKDRTFVTDKVELDYKKGKRRMAPFVAPRIGGVTIGREGFTTKSVDTPRIAPQRAMTIDDISHRSMGENIYSTKTPEQRQVEMTAKDLEELGQYIDRREEWMVAELLFGGKVIVQGYSDNNYEKKVEMEIDYGFDQFKVLSGTSLWTAAESEPYEDLKAWRLEVLQNSGIAPNIVVLGRSAYQAFLKNKEIRDIFDKLNMSFGVIQPTLKNESITFIGRLPEIGVEIYTYDDWYLDDEGNEKSFVPANKVLIGHSGQGGFLYGAVTQMEQGGKFVTYEASRVPKFWGNMDNDVAMVRLTSRPVPQPENVNSWLVATVV